MTDTPPVPWINSDDDWALYGAASRLGANYNILRNKPACRGFVNPHFFPNGQVLPREDFIVQIAPSLFPPLAPSESNNRVCLVQVQLNGVNGSHHTLQSQKGIRNYIINECVNNNSVSGFVWRESKGCVKVLASGTKEELQYLLDFCEALIDAKVIKGYVVERPEKKVWVKGFIRLPSKNQKKLNNKGEYSDESDDDEGKMEDDV